MKFLQSQIVPLIGMAAGCLLAGAVWSYAFSAPALQQPEPQPTPDRLAIPVLPANPTQVDLGLQVYYYHCMPCHGDQGQGLTEEWRQAWVEDHQNCWNRGCHAGRSGDEGFPLPKYIPGVRDLTRFTDPQDLFNYLKSTHPPQNPGGLSEAEYWQVVAYLLHQAGRLDTQAAVGLGTQVPTIQEEILSLLAITAITLIVSLALIRQTRITG